MVGARDTLVPVVSGCQQRPPPVMSFAKLHVRADPSSVPIPMVPRLTCKADVEPLGAVIQDHPRSTTTARVTNHGLVNTLDPVPGAIPSLPESPTRNDRPQCSPSVQYSVLVSDLVYSLHAVSLRLFCTSGTRHNRRSLYLPSQLRLMRRTLD